MRWDWLGALDWELAKKVAGSRLVTLAALFPFFGYLALLNTEIVKYLDLYLDTNEGFGSAALARIEEIYFALIWISIGVIVYQVRCPHEIKQFRNRYEMVAKEMEVASPLRLKSLRDNLSSQKCKPWVPKQLREEIDSIHQETFEDHTASVGEPLGFASGNPSRQDYLSSIGNKAVALLNVLYDFKRQSRPIARFISFAFLLIGYVKLSIPSAKVFFELVTA